MPKPILLDMDPGVDDALALILALRSPELAVKAITTVAGNVQVQKCTRNALRILKLLQLPEPPIVAQGARKPLRRRLFTAPEVHGEDGLGDIRRLSSMARARVTAHAVDVIIRSCRAHDGKLTIVAVGPLTNLALAWRKDPGALGRARRIITMGGAFHVPGNTGPVAEFNYYVDPEAAHLLFQSGLPITIVPLDITQQLVLMRKELEYRAARRASPVANAILEFTRIYMLRHKVTQGFHGGYLHDPVAVAAAIDHSILTTKRVHVDVETAGSFTRGMTVADFRLKAGKRDPLVAIKIDRDRFFRLFHERLWQ